MKGGDGVTKDEGWVKPRFYKSKGKRGCRAYLGCKYMGYFASEQEAHEALDKSKPLEKAAVVEKVAVHKVYKHVIDNQEDPKGANVPGSHLDPDQEGAVDQ